jgi:osmotically-inducible protein OsmY
MLASPGVYGMTGGFAPSVAQELSIGFAAPAILAAVATRRGQPMGPTNDHEVEEFIYDALELLPGTSEVEVRCDQGRAILTGSVQHKRLKHDVGEIAWAIPSISDVQNNVTISTRRRSRSAAREAETIPTPVGRKQA